MTKHTITLEELHPEIDGHTAQPIRGVRWGIITATIGLTIMGVVLMVLIWMNV